MGAATIPEARLTVDEIAEKLGIGIAELHRIARNAEKDHVPRLLKIGKKTRRLLVPRPPLKALQRVIHRNVLGGLPLPDTVYGLRGRGVIENARCHVPGAYVSVRDIQDCFPSVKLEMIVSALCNAGLDENAARLVTRLCTARGELPQGPPTSPALLNLVLVPLDSAIGQLVAPAGITYTRYVDDMTFSAGADMTSTIRCVEKLVREHGFRINTRKRRDWSPGRPATVTGIVLSTTLNPEPEFLDALASTLADLKRGECELTEAQIVGKIAWVEALNPALGRKITKKFRKLVEA